MKDNKILNELETNNPVPERLKPENVKRMLDNQIPARIKVNTARRTVSLVAAVAVMATGTIAYLNLNDSRNRTLKSENSQKALFEGYDFVDNAGAIPTNISGLSSMSYDELYEHMVKNSYIQYSADGIYFSSGALKGQSDITADTEITESATDNSISADNVDMSQTYRQEDDVDEADIVKTDGKTIFYCANGIVDCYSATGAGMQKLDVDFSSLFKSDFEWSYVQEMYLSDEVLTLVVSGTNQYDYMCYNNEEAESNNDISSVENMESAVTVVSFDVSNMDNIKLCNEYTQQGYYNQSRMIDGKAYVVSSYYPAFFGVKTDYPQYVPRYECNDEQSFVASGDIYVLDDNNAEDVFDSYDEYTIVGSVDIMSAESKCDVKTFVTSSSTVYVSSENMYLATTNYSEDSPKTAIIKIALNDGNLDVVAMGETVGRVNDRYSLKEIDENLVVATTSYEEIDGSYSEVNYVTCLDSNLNRLGITGGFGRNETIRSVTFDENYAYVVTFEQTDPLFAIDISDMTNPVITDDLKATGFSSHMRAFGDDKILGFGYSADEDGTLTGIKMSMFSNEDNNNLKELDSVSYEYNEDEMLYYSSTAQYDEKALLVEADKNIIAFPLQKDDYYNDYSSSNSAYGYEFYRYDDETGFTLAGEYSDEHSYDCYCRAIYVDDVIYIFSYEDVVALDMNDFSVLSTAEVSDNSENYGTIYYD